MSVPTFCSETAKWLGHYRTPLFSVLLLTYLLTYLLTSQMTEQTGSASGTSESGRTLASVAHTATAVETTTLLLLRFERRDIIAATRCRAIVVPGSTARLRSNRRRSPAAFRSGEAIETATQIRSNTLRVGDATARTDRCTDTRECENGEQQKKI